MFFFIDGLIYRKIQRRKNNILLLTL